MRFGLDFGTSNTSLAVSEGEVVRVLPLDPLAGEVMPTLLYIRRGGDTIVGQGAIEAYLSDNRERGPITRQVSMLGIRVASSVPGIPPVEAHILSDRSAPGRFFQALKTFLGDPLLVRTTVFGDARGLSELIAIVLAYVRERSVALTGSAPTEVTLGRPVRFIGDDASQDLALTRLRDAATLAGFTDVTFVEEPIAAARAAAIEPGTALVFDFGGGTLDLCVVRREHGALRVLSVAGAGIGGDKLTELLIDEYVAPVMGSRSAWGPKRLPLPGFLTQAVADWHALSALNERRILDVIDDLVRAGAPRRELRALQSAIELQLGYEIFRAVDEAKKRLSTDAATLVSYHRGQVDFDVRVVRRVFERRMSLALEGISGLVKDALDRAGLGPGAIDEIVCTGGSSAIPVVRELLQTLLPEARLRDASPFSSVAAGLTLAPS